MRKQWMFVTALAILGCAAPPAPPQYMRDRPLGEEDSRRALTRMRDEIGPHAESVRVDDVFFLVTDAGLPAIETATATIRRLSVYLQSAYFFTKPTAPIRIYALRNHKSYVAFAHKSLKRYPSTPFGFYLPDERLMVLNLETGTGTLAHELVHPLLTDDFPATPAWFNEGFASLFEHSETRPDGRIVGKSNWRLRNLRAALKEVRIESLIRTRADEFYSDDRGLHYAAARYVCLYLQEAGLLESFYREFRATANVDQTGKTALEKVTGRSLEEFDRHWRAWVEGL
ncbi:MAG: hypothetical protein HY716_04475 [Planctomycetes bacterium]|nr:hypothetical protein [Planctomycetota bacterium]